MDRFIYHTGLIVLIVIGLSIGVAVIHGLIWIGVSTLWLLLTYPLYSMMGIFSLLVLTATKLSK